MLGQLTGKVAVITGASQGIGAAIARVFAAAGARIVVADIAVEKGEDTVKAINASGGEAIFLEADISRRQRIKKLLRETAEHFGRLDIVVHNAASFLVSPIEHMESRYLEASLSVILKPAFWLAQDSLPHFRKQGAGRLLFTSSVTGPTVVTPGVSNYAAAKAGINGFIKAAAVELAAENITVNGVEPGFIRTDAMDILADEEGLRRLESYIPQKQLGKPEDIANAMLFLASDEASYVTGQTIIVDGGNSLVENAALLEAGKLNV